jgi:hypothetical protein
MIFIGKCIYNLRASVGIIDAKKLYYTAKIFTYPFLWLNCCLSLSKSDSMIGWAFTKGISECLLEQANDAGYANL